MSSTEWMLCLLALMGLLGMLTIPVFEQMTAIRLFHEKIVWEEALVSCSGMRDRALNHVAVHPAGDCGIYPYSVHGATISLNEWVGGDANHYG